MTALFDGHDPQQLDDLAGRLIQAFLAIVDFGRAAHEPEPELFGAAVVKALIFSEAAAITNDPAATDAQIETALLSHADALRVLVADLRKGRS